VLFRSKKEGRTLNSLPPPAIYFLKSLILRAKTGFFKKEMPA